LNLLLYFLHPGHFVPIQLKGGGLASYENMIPAKWLPIAALVFAASSTLKDSVNHLVEIFTVPPKGS
jgi:hypothetical protein